MSGFTLRTQALVLLCSGGLLLAACDNGDDPAGPEPTLSGRVFNAATGESVAGAVVRIGEISATTGTDGRFELSGFRSGDATIECATPGFQTYSSAITLKSGPSAYDIALLRIEQFEFGAFSLFVPAQVTTVRGILLALGGPDTRAFATGGTFGAPVAEVEQSLMSLGVAYRSLAATHGLAVLGVAPPALAEGAASDQLLLNALKTGAQISARAELESAPILMYGMSGGAPEAAGFVVRNPGRIAGLFLKVPVNIATFPSGAAQQVPSYAILAEFDAFVDNGAVAAIVDGNRRTGALWAIAMERGVPHHSLSPAQRGLTVDWMRAILDLRLPSSGTQLRAITESTGWLGDPFTGLAAAWAVYAGDRTVASWFPTQGTAEQWQAFVR